ncbi:MAG: hypothetical protein L3J75_07490 [Methylococcaceae bacterium]|nr:hypothetical protein [Methylococcaceae bacterium]
MKIMGGKYDYSEENISNLLDHLEELRSEGRLKIMPMLNGAGGIEEKIAKYNKDRPAGYNAVKAYSTSTLYKKFKDRERLLNAIGKEAFHATIEYLSERGLLEKEVSKHNLYHAVFDFLSISKENKKLTETLAPGFFRTYRPSLSKPGYAVVGILHIYKNKKGDLKTEEVIPYRVNPKEKRRRHVFKGYLWRTCGHYLSLTTDSNTKFMQTHILRSAYVDGDKIITMEGTYAGISNQQGIRIFTTRIFLERIEAEPFGKGWFQVLLTLGSKVRNDNNPRNQIPEYIWEIIDPKIEGNMMFF